MSDDANGDCEKSLLEAEFEEFEADNSWNLIFQRLRNEATTDSYSATNNAARLSQNRGKNRYRDILPYDHSRVVLQDYETDYINASLLEIAEANRRYILTQGPLPNTVGDFWTMCWQQESRGIVMLSRLFEKDTAKCHPYYPDSDEPGYCLELQYSGLRVTLSKYEDCMYYVVRTISLERTATGERRDVLHFQYLTWPDFGCPHSPASFLNFLLAIRRAGVLSDNCGPCIVHCSAGVGRSGSFCLVDSALRIIERTRSLDSIDVRRMLISMRRARVGLIQSNDQLRFTYLAIIEGGHAVLRLDPGADADTELSFEASEADANLAPSASTSSSEPAERISLPSSSTASSAASSTKSLNLVASRADADDGPSRAEHAPSKRKSNELPEDTNEYVSASKRPRRPRALTQVKAAQTSTNNK